MNHILTILLLGLTLFSCEPNASVDGKVKKDGFSKADIIRMPISANQPMDTSLVAKMVFDNTVYEFGTVLEGAQVEHVFKFKNTGKIPLIISEAKATCGCTVPSYPEDPIPPGESGEVSVKFNTAGKKNDQSKPVSLMANTFPARTVIMMKGYVQPNQQLQKALEQQNQ